MLRWVGVSSVAMMVACPTPSVDNLDNGNVVDGTATGVAVASQPGVAPLAVVVRAVNGLGVSTGPGTVQVTVDGVATDVQVDAFGYGTTQVSASGEVNELVVNVLSSASPTLELPPAKLVTQVGGIAVAARAGFLVSEDRQVWWTGPGMADHLVADLRAPVSGMRSGNVDQDGVVDAIVWGGDTVVLLRGRPDGGAGFGAGVEAPGWTALSAEVGDLDEDGDSDLAILWDTPEKQVLQVWFADGLWGFSPGDETGINGQGIDLGVAVDRPDSPPVLTVLVVAEEWRRYRVTQDGKLVVTGNNLTIDAEVGSRLYTPGDLSGDGIEELLVAPPRRSGAPRPLQIWELGEERSTVLTVDVPGGWFASGDSQPDGLADLWLLSEEPAYLQTLVPDGTTFLTRDHGITPVVGPVAVGSFDNDLFTDLFVAGSDAWLFFHGAEGGDDNHWIPARGALNRRNVGLLSTISPADVESGVDEVAGVSDVEGVTSVRLWTLRDAGPVDALTVDLLAGNGVPLDFVACDNNAWVLFADEVVHVNLATGAIEGRLDLDGGLTLACKPGTDGVIAAVAMGTSVRSLNSGAGDGGQEPGVAEDVAFVDGQPTGCAGPCAAWPGFEGGDGLVEWVGGSLQLQVGDVGVRVAGGPDLVVQDSDDDGEFELWSKDGRGLVTVVRQSGTTAVVERSMQVSVALEGAPLALTGVGRPDALWLTDGGDLCWTP